MTWFAVEDRVPGFAKRAAAVEWVASASYGVLGKCVLVQSGAHEIAVATRRFFRAFPPCPHPTTPPDLTLSFDAPAGAIPSRQGEPTRGPERGYWQILPQLQAELGVFLTAAIGDYCLLHAGAVSLHGKGLLLPAPSEGGKSTLSLALVLLGADYFSDEIAAIDLANGDLLPFPKPLTCRDRSLHPALAQRPDVWFGPAGQNWETVWYTHADDIRPGSVGTRADIHSIIFPQHDAGQAPRLQPLTPDQAMRLLIANSVNFARLGAHGLQTLGRLARSAQCFTLASDNPAAAAELIAGRL